MAELKPGKQNGSQFGCLAAGILGVGFLLWAVGQKDAGTSALNSASAYDGNLSTTAEATASPQPPAPLDVRAARRAFGQFRMVAAAHVPGSSEIFSQNCYEGLTKPISWYELDRCGAYDALAVRWVQENDSTAGNDDLTYFQSETAATRYLQEATRGGLLADQADTRWATLQSMALKTTLVRQAAAPVEATPPPMNDDESGVDAPVEANGAGADSADDAGE
ncbi:MAG: hypothetical protein ACJ8LM_15135 [Candidatus Udaeobacter sp.]